MDSSSSRPSSRRRPRTPAITVDTSAINQDQEPSAPDPTSSPRSPGGFDDSNTLAVPTRTSRAQSWDSSKSTPSTIQTASSPGSEQTDPLRKPSTADASNYTGTTKTGGTDPLGALPGEEALFNVPNNPFGFMPGHLSKIFDPKNPDALAALGGLAGLEKGLKTDRRAGLGLDEVTISKPITFEEATAVTDAPSPTNGGPDVAALAKEFDDGKPSTASNHSDGFSDRKRVFGENVLPDRKSKSLLQLAWIALQDRVLILLCVAAVVSLALGLYQTFGSTAHHDGAKVEWVEGVAIVVAILIVVIVGALNDWQKERQFRKLNKKKEDRTVKVIRSGKPSNISVHHILVGDVMLLEAGDVLPVDGVYIEGHNVSCDESSATGESDLIKKMPADAVLAALKEGTTSLKKLDPFMISGARVLDGYGTFLVTAVGENSSHGRTMMSLRDDPGLTPLQIKLNILAGYIAKLGSAAGILLLLTLTIEFLARLPGNTDTPEQKGQSFLQILITSITIVVVAVPEGLPLAVTLSLAYATKRMTKENNLVRHLQSCETMGNATVICSDKTGTLTENVMTVVAGTLGAGSVSFSENDEEAPDASEPGTSGKDVEADDAACPDSSSGSRLNIDKLGSQLSDEYKELLKQSVVANTTAFEEDQKGKKVFVGTKTETALLDWVRRCFALGPLSEERENIPTQQLSPFNSKRKAMGVVIRLPQNKYRFFVKGAPEIVLEHCQATIGEPTASPSRTSLDDAHRTQVKQVITKYATKSLRTLALAYRDFESWPPPNTRKEEGTDNIEFSDLFRDMVWLGVVGIRDPVRAAVPTAVKHCHTASVSVKMVTGDNVETARAIATECGILTEGGRVMEGIEFRRLPDDKRIEVVRELQVLARSSPEDKRILVKTLKGLGDVVAVTGDGTNDAPALKAADVGFSMGITGTEVAKEASDIILMDDNFSSIVGALAWGRAINDAVKKFLQFQITVNITAVVLTFVSAVADENETSVLSAIQLLWVNLIMDTFAALALATDPPTESQLRRAPEPKTAPLITLTMWKMIIGQSIYQLIVCFVLHFAGPKFLKYPADVNKSLVFNTFVFMQIFKLVNSRRIDNELNIFEGLSRNRLFMVMMSIMIAGQVLIIFVGGPAFVVTRLNGPQWGISLVLGFMSIPIGILIRLFPDSIIRTCTHWVVKHTPSIPMPKMFKKKEKKADPEMIPGSVGNTLLSIRDDLAFLKRVRGGRMNLISEAIVHPVEVVRRTRSRSRTGGSNSEDDRSSMSPMRSAMGSALGMPGILAASVGGLSPIERQPSTGEPGDAKAPAAAQEQSPSEPVDTKASPSTPPAQEEKPKEKK